MAERLDAECSAIDADIERLVYEQAATARETEQRVRMIGDEILDLASRLESIQERAARTETLVSEMTVKIKSLDTVKRNLTLSMTMLKRLQMLVSAYDQLMGQIEAHSYADTAHLLQAVLQLMQHFKSYRSIDQIAALGRSISSMQQRILAQVFDDLKSSLDDSGSSASRGGRGKGSRAISLTEACQTVAVLGDEAKTSLISWFCDQQLKEYFTVFRSNTEAASLDNISRRFAWLKQILRRYEDEYALVFPASWNVGEHLVLRFGEEARKDVSNELRRMSSNAQNVTLLLNALAETLEFETYLERRFSGNTRVSIDSFVSTEEGSSVRGEQKSVPATPGNRQIQPASVFGKLVSEAFEPYLELYIDSQDRVLASLLEKFRSTEPSRALEAAATATGGPEDDESPASVLDSSPELFHQYRQMLNQCIKLTRGRSLVRLSRVFARHLRLYSEQILQRELSAIPTTVPGNMDETKSVTSTLYRTAAVINTADYMLKTIKQLEDKFRRSLDPAVASGEAVSYSGERTALQDVVVSGIRHMVAIVMASLQPAVQEMQRIDWQSIDDVGDHSSYAPDMVHRLTLYAREALQRLENARFASAFCERLVEAFVRGMLASIAIVRPVSEVGAEQMLLDLYLVRQRLVTLPELVPRGIDESVYVQAVQREWAKLECLLKVILTRSSPPEGLVQNYLYLVGDSGEANFAKILELKGIRRGDQPAIMALYTERVGEQEKSGGESIPGLMSSINLAEHALPPATAAAAAAAFSPAHRFDPSSLSAALFAAAKDGVDRGARGLQGLAVATSDPTALSTAETSNSPAHASPGVGLWSSATSSPAPADAGDKQMFTSFRRFFKRPATGGNSLDIPR